MLLLGVEPDEDDGVLLLDGDVEVLEGDVLLEGEVLLLEGDVLLPEVELPEVPLPLVVSVLELPDPEVLLEGVSLDVEDEDDPEGL